MNEIELAVKAGSPSRVAAIRDMTDGYGHVRELYQKLVARAKALDLTPTGPWLAIYCDKGPVARNVDVEVAFPVEAETATDGRLAVRDLPVHAQILSLLVHGPYDQLSGAYDQIMGWVRQSKYIIDGRNREIYLEGPEMHDEPANYVTEIQFPIVARTED